MFIKQQILSGSRNNFAIIVPTKALINEVRTKITEDLGLSLKEYRYHWLRLPETLHLRLMIRADDMCSS